MKRFSRIQIFAWILAVIPLVMIAAVYGRLPAEIPTNWGFNGVVLYGSKSTLWMMGGLSVLFAVLFPLIPYIDPRRKNYDKFMPSYDLFQVIMMLFMIAMCGIIIVESFWPGTVSVGTAVTAICSVLFIILGNMLPKFRQNYFGGLRNPWTLDSETVWIRTHRLAGRMLFGAGILGFLSCLMPEKPRMIFFFTVLMVALLIPNVMSYIWYREEQKNKP